MEMGSSAFLSQWFNNLDIIYQWHQTYWSGCRENWSYLVVLPNIKDIKKGVIFEAEFVLLGRAPTVESHSSSQRLWSQDCSEDNKTGIYSSRVVPNFSGSQHIWYGINLEILQFKMRLNLSFDVSFWVMTKAFSYVVTHILQTS